MHTIYVDFGVDENLINTVYSNLKKGGYINEQSPLLILTSQGDEYLQAFYHYKCLSAWGKINLLVKNHFSSLVSLIAVFIAFASLIVSIISLASKSAN